MKEVMIFTDGACSGNPGPGGWGTILRFGEHEKELCGGEKNTTNNRICNVFGIRHHRNLARFFKGFQSAYNSGKF
ncbi:MAG: hypothetical protein IJE83_01565, partial [Oscillospiraceae bacterium]|nr:hypothetical protein [Oscillospiraceae bacterium]